MVPYDESLPTIAVKAEVDQAVTIKASRAKTAKYPAYVIAAFFHPINLQRQAPRGLIPR